MENYQLLALLSLSFYAVPALMMLPLFLANRADNSLSALNWLCLCLYAVLLSAFAARVKWSGIEWLQITYDYVLFPFAFLIFIFLIIRANVHLVSMKPVWLRLIAGVSLISMICFAFGGIAERIDGDEGLLDIPQYGFEFYLRAVDLFTFGTLSNYFPEVLSEGIQYTARSSATVVIFNVVMGLYAFNIITRILISAFREPSSASS